MANKDNVVDMVDGALLLLRAIGWVFYTITQTRIDELKNENITLRKGISNLIQRVDYYHGTNWNYLTSKPFSEGDRK